MLEYTDLTCIAPYPQVYPKRLASVLYLYYATYDGAIFRSALLAGAPNGPPPQAHGPYPSPAGQYPVRARPGWPVYALRLPPPTRAYCPARTPSARVRGSCL